MRQAICPHAAGRSGTGHTDIVPAAAFPGPALRRTQSRLSTAARHGPPSCPSSRRYADNQTVDSQTADNGSTLQPALLLEPILCRLLEPVISYTSTYPGISAGCAFGSTFALQDLKRLPSGRRGYHFFPVISFSPSIASNCSASSPRPGEADLASTAIALLKKCKATQRRQRSVVLAGSGNAAAPAGCLAN